MEQQLAQCLEGTLSADAVVRTQAEAALLQLHNERSCGLSLAHLTLSPSLSPTIRKSSAVSLRKWIRERWSGLFDGFVGFSPSGEPLNSEEKIPIRTALLEMLTLRGSESRRLRVIGAACLSSVCSSDWPDDFPELLPTVQGLLRGGEQDCLHGALSFLSEFWTSEMDERQILGGAREMLPTIEALLGNETYPPSLRARCVLIFRQLLQSLFMIRDVYKEASKQIANELLPKWIQALVGLVGQHDLVQILGNGTISFEDKHGWVALLNETWRTLSIASHFRGQFKPYLSDVLRLAIGHLNRLQDSFAQFYLSSESEPPFDAPDGDADITTTLPNLLCSIVDFIVEATRADKGRSVLVTTSGASDDLHSLFSSLISYARVTAEEEDEWTSDPNAFVAAIDEDAMEYGLRAACSDLIESLIVAYKATALNALSASVKRACASREDWKTVEAALAVMGAIGDLVEEMGAEDGAFLNDIFQSAVLPIVQGQSPLLLTGRAYIFASQYASLLPQDLARQFVEASTQALEASSLGSQEETLVVKLSAVRCVKNFYRRLPVELLAAYTPRIIAQLGPLVGQASGDTLLLILETIQGIVSDEARGDSEQSSGGDAIPPQAYGEIVKAVLGVWSRDVKDFILLSVITDLMESLASKRDPAVAHAVVSIAQPALVDAFKTAAASAKSGKASGDDGDDDDDDDDDSDAGGQGLLEAAMSIAESLLKGARSQTLTSCQTVHQLCGPIISALQDTQDRDVLQSGVGCLTQLVRKATADVANADVVGHLFSIISRLLSMDSESGGLKIGDFIIALLRKMPDAVSPVLGDLLGALARRLSTAQTAGFIQSLVMPFAYLLKENQSRVVCDLLLSLHVDKTSTGLEILASKWTENTESMQGFWAQKLSTVGLSKLLESGREDVLNITVRGDLIPDESTTIRTRSKARAKPDEYTSITLGQKIVKILVREYQGTASTQRKMDDDDDDEDEDEEWDSDSDDEEPKDKNHQMLSDFLDFDPAELDDGGEEDDLKDDDVWGMDLKAYLTDVFKGLAQSSSAAHFASALTSDEVASLRAVVG